MMSDTFLLDDFYGIQSTQKPDKDKLLVNIELNVAHQIFKGHFEQMPVVPGVCQTQIIKEVLQKETGKDLTLTTGTNIKFTGMIVPTQHPNFNLQITYVTTENKCSVDAQLFFENIIFTKFKGVFTIN